MSRSTLILTATIGLAVLAGCKGRPASAPTLAPGTTYQVNQILDLPAPDGVTLGIPEPGKLAGQAPCNRWFAEFSQSDSTLEIGPAGATRMACIQPDRMQAEATFFEALGRVTVIATGPEAGQIALGDGSRTLLILSPDV